MEKPSSIHLFILTLLLIGACSNKNNQLPGKILPSIVKAPDFEVTTIKGNNISLSSTLKQGKPMAIYFTASW